jgi:WD40 repeat protein
VDNDGVIKLWDLEGTCVQSIVGHLGTKIYSIASIPGDTADFATCGEEGQ